MRKSPIERKTNEVNIKGKLNIDGKGKYNVNTGNNFLNHILQEFSFHGLFDIELESKGDLKHHHYEELGFALGTAFRAALGDCKGIKRFGYSYVVMETALTRIVIDIIGRPYYKSDELYNARILPALDNSDTDGIVLPDIDTFMQGFSRAAKLNLHLSKTHYPAEQSGKGDAHHVLESIFKALGIALDQATQIEPRRTGIPSTKGIID